MDQRFRKSLFGSLFFIAWSLFAFSLTIVALAGGHFEWKNEPFYRDQITVCRESSPAFFWVVLSVWTFIGLLIGYRGVSELRAYLHDKEEADS